jgi:uncharacterized membrane protein YcaP (DUF421 family)
MVEPAVAAAKAMAMYAVALVVLRVGPRRTLSQWTAIDVVAAVALGAIVGRTAIARDEPTAVGAAALAAILAMHYLLTICRLHPRFARLVDHPVRILVDHGRVRPDQLRRCGLTEADVRAQLRRHGVGALADVRYVLYEAKGEITVVPELGAGTLIRTSCEPPCSTLARP